MSKLEFKSKSLDYDLSNNKRTHVILVDDNNSVVHIYLDESAIELTNGELYSMAMQELYDVNFPNKAENDKFNKVEEKIDAVDSAMDVIVAFAVSIKGSMNTHAYAKIASAAKPLVTGKRYGNGDVVVMPYPYDTNEKWPKGTPTIFSFTMQENEGYNYKSQKVEDMIKQGSLSMVMPRFD